VDEQRLAEAAEGRASALREADTLARRLRSLEAEREKERTAAAQREMRLRARLDALSVGSGGGEGRRVSSLAQPPAKAAPAAAAV